MKQKLLRLPLILLLSILLCACGAAPQVQSTYDPAELRFSGERALAIETAFVQRFPNRSSGQENNRLAADWLQAEFTRLGLTCALDEWEVVNYSRPVPLRNVICELPGESDRQILVVAHFDQSPATVQGADNDASGTAILLHLAEIFATEPSRPYTLVFLAADGEEYGMLGTRRFIQTHPDTRQILAGISLDNAGKSFYNGLDIDPRGQLRGYGALWLQRSAQEAARSAGDLWIPATDSLLDQILSQAVPISFMDEGPLVSAGVPAFGFAGLVPPEYARLHWDTYHNPDDTLEYQSADTLYQVGRATEALIRQLFSMQTFPQETGPYLYFEDSQQVLRGAPLWCIFAAIVALFFLAGVLTARKTLVQDPSRWRNALLHFLSLWLPLVAAVLLLYVFVAVGLMDKYELYPGTSKDPVLTHPKWLAVGLWLVGLVVFLWLGRWLTKRSMRTGEPAEWPQTKGLALLVTALSGLYVMLVNPFSLLFMIPLLFWFLIGGRRGTGKILDVVLFLLGGLIVYVLFYFFGYLILHINLAVLWYLMMMFSIPMISFPTATVIMAIIAAGLSMVVNPPQGKMRRARANQCRQ